MVTQGLLNRTILICCQLLLALPIELIFFFEIPKLTSLMANQTSMWFVALSPLFHLEIFIVLDSFVLYDS